MKFKTVSALYRAPSRWVKFKWAGVRVKEHDLVVPAQIRGKNANCWCLSGGIALVYPIKERSAIRRKVESAIKELFPFRTSDGSIIAFNDHADTTIEDVREVVRAAKV